MLFHLRRTIMLEFKEIEILEGRIVLTLASARSKEIKI
jgi:hypothetical protein